MLFYNYKNVFETAKKLGEKRRFQRVFALVSPVSGEFFFGNLQKRFRRQNERETLCLSGLYLRRRFFMKGRLIASVLSVSMIAGLLAGCGGGNTSQTSGGGGTSDTGSATTESTAETEAANNENSGEKITIRLTNWGTTADGEADQKLIDEFNETNDMNIEVVFDLVPSEGYGDRLTTSFSSGDGYDIFTSGEGDFFKWVDRGVAMSMDEVIAADEDFTQTLPDSLMNMGKINGQQ